jgi:putrescine aminotransferase
VPLGAIVGRPAAWSFFEDAPLLHTSTFGGNPLAMAVGLEALRVVIDEDLPGQAADKGGWLLTVLGSLAREYPDLIREVRGRGLMIGIETVTAGVGGALIQQLFERSVLAVYTLNNDRVIRMIPPLVIQETQLEQVMEAMEGALAAIRAMGLGADDEDGDREEPPPGAQETS